MFDPIAHLKIQLQFLLVSCEAYDRGFIHEGLRIATVLRTLLKDSDSKRKGRSISLFSHMEAAGHGRPLLLSTAERLHPNRFVMGSALSSTQLVIPGGASVEPNLGSSPHLHWQATQEEWWQQVVSSGENGDLTRCSLALTAAEKDGGVHVDDDVAAKPAYSGAKAGLVSFSINSEELTPIPDGHLADLRQMGFEILHSAEVLQLVK